MVSVDLQQVSVFIGMPVYGRIPPLTTLSLAHTAHAAGAGGIPFEIGMEQRGIVTLCRDQVLDSFLRSDKQKLFWIDSDIVWEPDAFLRLLALSTQFDVVCAAYPTRTDPMTFQIAGSGEPQEISPLGLLEVWGTGLGFTVMDRTVCQKLADAAPSALDQISGRATKAVFRTDIVDGVRRGEDMAFFADIRALGVPIWLDPTITLGHIGEKGWRGAAINTLKGE